MIVPQMILFDNGSTLTCEPDIDPLRAMRAVMPHITKNPMGLSAEELVAAERQVFKEIRPVREAGFEMHEWMLVRLIYGRLGIEFDIDMAEFERIFWTGLSTGEITPHADELLDHLNGRGIRTGVISNIIFSGSALGERLDRLLPNNRFEFIIASSDYAVRKPNRSLFEIAALKAGLPPNEIWYCGNSVRKDVIGAHSAGMIPVLYEGARGKDEEPDAEADFSDLHIGDWREMIELLP